ncbi:uncharacterized [Tachysurus ichikawai]
MQEMAEELEASEPKKETSTKEGLETAEKKLKCLSILWFQKLRKKMTKKKKTKESQQKEKERESEAKEA